MVTVAAATEAIVVVREAAAVEVVAMAAGGRGAEGWEALEALMEREGGREV